MPTLALQAHEIQYQLVDPHRLSTCPLILLHGLGSSGEDWPLQVGQFSTRYPVVTVDLPGHGRSTLAPGWPSIAGFAADISTLVDTLERGPAHVLGLSLGGLVGMQLALDWPATLCSLTIVNAYARLQPGPRGWLRALVRLVFLGLGRMDWVAAWIARGIFPDPDQETWRVAAAERIASNPGRTYVKVLRAVAGFNVVSRLGAIRTPTLVVAGERDSTISLRAKELLAERIPGAVFVRFPGSGHATPYDESTRFNQRVLEFLDQVESRRLM